LTNDATLERFYEVFDNSKLDYKYVVLIPKSGCSGCITNAETFFLENSYLEDILFIFTKVQSKKDLRIRVGDRANASNFFWILLQNIYFLTQLH